MKYIKGDLIELAKQGKFNFIAHGCNCFCNWGAGIAKQIKEEFPRSYIADCETKKGDLSKLGSYTSSTEVIQGQSFEKPIVIEVINAYTQYKYGGYRIHADYDAIRACFSKLAGSIHKEDAVIGIPKIGAGHAGGDWNVISKIIEEETVGLDITVVEYEEVT